MISTKDQEALFKLLANYIQEDLHCIAIGGTAMMFNNYKTTTKDIDLVFKTIADRKVFINAITSLGYKELSLKNIYDEKRKEHVDKPLMFTRGDERFDLFVGNVFGFKILFDDDKIVQRYDFLGGKNLRIDVLSAEQLVLLKAITNRERDFEDIITILNLKKDLDFDFIINEAINQRKNKEWILYELEETLQKLKKRFPIKQSYFDKLYSAEEKK